MKLARTDRSLVAWTLYACVLFNLFAYGMHHGQMSGLALSGLGGVFCSLYGNASSRMDVGDFESEQKSAQPAMNACPLCASVALALAINSGTWASDYVPGNAVAPIVVRSWAQPPPRYNWPSLNPRAPPATPLAVNLLA